MITDESNTGTHPLPELESEPRPTAGPDSSTTPDVANHEREVEYIVDECFFTVGQVVGMRKTIDYEAVIWWREHYRARFLAAMRAFGNRWVRDRANVTSVAIMLAERAVRYSEGAMSIHCEAAQRAAHDVERYCALHSKRHGGRSLTGESETALPRIAGYWCVYDPEP